MSIALTLLVYSFTVFLAALQALVLYKIATNQINLQLLLSDDRGDASLSRFQLLIFTFVIGASFLYLTVKGAAFPPVNEGVLLLLGISSATYALGKSLEKPSPSAPSAPSAGPQSTHEAAPTVAVTKATQTTTVG